MKFLFISAVLFVFHSSSFAQITEPIEQPATTFTQEDYLKKSKTQKTAAWILTGAGTVGLIGTLVADASQSAGGAFVTILSLGTVEPEYKSLTAYYVISAAFVATGVGFFIASSNNRKHADALNTTAFIKMENAPRLTSVGLGKQSFPSFAVSIKF